MNIWEPFPEFPSARPDSEADSTAAIDRLSEDLTSPRQSVYPDDDASLPPLRVKILSKATFNVVEIGSVVCTIACQKEPTLKPDFTVEDRIVYRCYIARGPSANPADVTRFASRIIPILSQRGSNDSTGRLLHSGSVRFRKSWKHNNFTAASEFSAAIRVKFDAMYPEANEGTTAGRCLFRASDNMDVLEAAHSTVYPARIDDHSDAMITVPNVSSVGDCGFGQLISVAPSKWEPEMTNYWERMSNPESFGVLPWDVIYACGSEETTMVIGDPNAAQKKIAARKEKDRVNRLARFRKTGTWKPGDPGKKDVTSLAKPGPRSVSQASPPRDTSSCTSNRPNSPTNSLSRARVRRPKPAATSRQSAQSRVSLSSGDLQHQLTLPVATGSPSQNSCRVVRDNPDGSEIDHQYMKGVGGLTPEQHRAMEAPIGGLKLSPIPPGTSQPPQDGIATGRPHAWQERFPTVPPSASESSGQSVLSHDVPNGWPAVSLTANLSSYLDPPPPSLTSSRVAVPQEYAPPIQRHRPHVLNSVPHVDSALMQGSTEDLAPTGLAYTIAAWPRDDASMGGWTSSRPPPDEHLDGHAHIANLESDYSHHLWTGVDAARPLNLVNNTYSDLTVANDISMMGEPHGLALDIQAFDDPTRSLQAQNSQNSLPPKAGFYRRQDDLAPIVPGQSLLSPNMNYQSWANGDLSFADLCGGPRQEIDPTDHGFGSFTAHLPPPTNYGPSQTITSLRQRRQADDDLNTQQRSELGTRNIGASLPSDQSAGIHTRLISDSNTSQLKRAGPRVLRELLPGSRVAPSDPQNLPARRNRGPAHRNRGTEVRALNPVPILTVNQVTVPGGFANTPSVPAPSFPTNAYSHLGLDAADGIHPSMPMNHFGTGCLEPWDFDQIFEPDGTYIIPDAPGTGQ